MRDDELLLACVQRKLDAAGWLELAARLTARPELAEELAELEALAVGWQEETAAAEAAVAVPGNLTRRMLARTHVVMREETVASGAASPVGVGAGWAELRRSLAPVLHAFELMQGAWKMALAPLAAAGEPAAALERLSEQKGGF
ncbi:MAG: hypothetical protein QM296_01425 [Bacillota bacterium]|nr:hypothetical protein [Bacillota bacterium]